MSHDHPPGPLPAEDTPAEHRLNTVQIIGGAVVGFISSWLLLAVTLLVLYDTLGDSTLLNVLSWGALVLPAVVSGALLVPSKTRYWSAGLMVGLAIGSILGAGVCVGFGLLGG